MNSKNECSSRPVSIVVIGTGNRANKYLEFVFNNPDKAKLVGIVELNNIRRNQVAAKFNLKEEQCYTDYDSFFVHPIVADAILICTPENKHFEPCMRAIHAGYHVLLEKPIAQTLEECVKIGEAAKQKGVMVNVCHVLHYHPYFLKLKEIVTSGKYGEIISIEHKSCVGIDRSTHGFVRGLYRKEEVTNPMLISKSCHDIDFLLWLTGTHCKKLMSFGSLKWFKKGNAPKGSAERCIHCQIESNCPFSAVNLYHERHDWISNFDVPKGKTKEEVIEEQLASGPYGRCVYHCDNDVVDHQLVAMEMENEVTINFTMDIFTRKDRRETHIVMTEAEIFGNEREIHIIPFRNGEELVYDFNDIAGTAFHAGSDLNLIAHFIEIVRTKQRDASTSIEKAIESHRICFEAERSRTENKLVLFD